MPGAATAWLARRWAAVSSTAPLLALIAVIWVTTRPYAGIVGDARFYMVQALHQLDPGRFAHDLYFQFGSQDRFTIFSYLYAPIVASLRVASAGIVCTIAAQLLWVSCLLYLAQGLVRDRRLALLAVAVTVALPGTYGKYFTYGEAFITPRLLAEALTLAGLGLLVRKRPLRALIVLLVGGAVHPLSTLPGLALLFVYSAGRRPLWWAAIPAGMVAAALLSSIGIAPFSSLRVTLDPTWFDIIVVRDAFGFVTQWAVEDYCRGATTISLAVLLALSADPRERRLLCCALMVGIGGLLCALIGGDILRNVFVVEIQPWRALWLLTLVTYLYTVPGIIRFRRLGERAQMITLSSSIALGYLLISAFIPDAVIFCAAPVLVVTAGLAAWQHATGREPPKLVRGAWLVGVVIACVVANLFSFSGLVLAWSWPEALWRFLASLALIVAALGVSLITVAQTPTLRKFSRFAPWLAAALLPFALLRWDARTPWTRFVESPGPIPGSLAALVPPDASVYWEGGLEMLWFRLNRPSYFSCDQGTGSVFFRGNAIEFERRAQALGRLHTLDFGRSPLCPGLDGSSKPALARADLQGVCNHEPRLDYVVLTQPVESVSAKVWNSPVPAHRDLSVVGDKVVIHDIDRFYIYSCRNVRSGA